MAWRHAVSPRSINASLHGWDRDVCPSQLPFLQSQTDPVWVKYTYLSTWTDGISSGEKTWGNFSPCPSARPPAAYWDDYSARLLRQITVTLRTPPDGHAQTHTDTHKHLASHFRTLCCHHNFLYTLHTLHFYKSPVVCCGLFPHKWVLGHMYTAERHMEPLG